MERSYSETEVRKLIAEALAPLQQRIVELVKRVVELETQNARLKKDSSNSSKPPSSDIVKPPKEPPAGGGKRTIGGQPGHVKHQRQPFAPEQIDHIVTHEKPNPGRLEALDEWVVLQQIELTASPCIITEHRARLYRDPVTGRRVAAGFPSEVAAAGLFGPHLTALVAYLKSAGHMSYTAIARFCRDVLKITISRGQLAKVIQKASTALAPAHAELAACLPRQEQLHVDETGHKERRQAFWTWVLRAELFTFFTINASRGSKVLVELLGEQFAGVLNCDYFWAYRKYMADCDILVQFCLAHLIRDVKFLTTLPDAATRNYGQRLLEALRQLFRIIHRREKMSPQRFQRALEQARDRILKVGRRAPPRRAAQNLAARFGQHGAAYFRFVTTPGVEPTNNLAEQAIRFVVLDRYVTQGTRSLRGREFCQRAWTAVATCAQQGRSVYTFLSEAIAAAFHGRPAPSLLPA